jgi:hypothetical protein
MAADRNIAPGDTPQKPTTPKPNDPASAKTLPKLSEKLRDRLEQLFDKEGNFGTKAGPTEAAVRRLMREGLAAGLNEDQVGNFLHPGFYRGVNDPSGGGRLLKDLTPEQLTALSEYAGKQRGNGLEGQSSTQAQADFFAAFPDLNRKYMELAGFTPEYIDQTFANQAASSAQKEEGAPQLYQSFTNFTGEQSGVPGYPDYATAMTQAQSAFANHYATAATMGDFTTAQTAFGALQQHNEMMAPVAPAPVYSGPESFSEADLYDKPQTQ